MRQIISMLYVVRRAGAAVVCAALFSPIVAFAADLPRVEEDGTIHVPAFLLPESSFLGKESRAALIIARARQGEEDAAEKACLPIGGSDQDQTPAVRKCVADVMYKSALYKRVRELYQVTIKPQEIGGVYTEVFIPKMGIPAKNKHRVLINLHLGGFSTGSRTFSHLESIPIASVGKMKVISIDYRQLPEYTFPAASEDVAAVYQQLLKSYRPENIGIYGCSAGGLLTAEAMAWFEKERLPMPGAIGMFCAAGSYFGEGDSGRLVAVLLGFPPEQLADPRGHPYFKNTDPNDPLVFPVRSAQVMAKFPPSLLITATRDQGLSSVVYMHSRLVALGVEAELHVWEGLDHGFFMDPDLPQSREVYDVTVKFFDRHLGSN